MYEFVTRHFLACCSRDAKGNGSSVTAKIAGETFTASGLMVTERNYLDVYVYERWRSSAALPIFEIGDSFQPSALEMAEGSTTPGRCPLRPIIAIKLMARQRHRNGRDYR